MARLPFHGNQTPGLFTESAELDDDSHDKAAGREDPAAESGAAPSAAPRKNRRGLSRCEKLPFDIGTPPTPLFLLPLPSGRRRLAAIAAPVAHAALIAKHAAPATPALLRLRQPRPSDGLEKSVFSPPRSSPAGDLKPFVVNLDGFHRTEWRRRRATESSKTPCPVQGRSLFWYISISRNSQTLRFPGVQAIAMHPLNAPTVELMDAAEERATAVRRAHTV
ncbi:hypothetical protein AURDEDRAFT_167745 [Auricularia subglabra TFB-10046 SS5]|nr:hypothetical protein AURDEDRAFT_167745 [Auricularia subglabra TFB-10046 SS5]